MASKIFSNLLYPKIITNLQSDSTISSQADNYSEFFIRSPTPFKCHDENAYFVQNAVTGGIDAIVKRDCFLDTSEHCLVPSTHNQSNSAGVSLGGASNCTRNINSFNSLNFTTNKDPATINETYSFSKTAKYELKPGPTTQGTDYISKPSVCNSIFPLPSNADTLGGALSGRKRSYSLINSTVGGSEADSHLSYGTKSGKKLKNVRISTTNNSAKSPNFLSTNTNASQVLLEELNKESLSAIYSERNVLEANMSQQMTASKFDSISLWDLNESIPQNESLISCTGDFVNNFAQSFVNSRIDADIQSSPHFADWTAWQPDPKICRSLSSTNTSYHSPGETTRPPSFEEGTADQFSSFTHLQQRLLCARSACKSDYCFLENIAETPITVDPPLSSSATSPIFYETGNELTTNKDAALREAKFDANWSPKGSLQLPHDRLCHFLSLVEASAAWEQQTCMAHDQLDNSSDGMYGNDGTRLHSFIHKDQQNSDEKHLELNTTARDSILPCRLEIALGDCQSRDLLSETEKNTSDLLFSLFDNFQGNENPYLDAEGSQKNERASNFSSSDTSRPADHTASIQPNTPIFRHIEKSPQNFSLSTFHVKSTEESVGLLDEMNRATQSPRESSDERNVRYIFDDSSRRSNIIEKLRHRQKVRSTPSSDPTKQRRQLIKPSRISCYQLRQVMPLVIRQFESSAASRKGLCRQLTGQLYPDSPKPSPNFLLNTLLPVFRAAESLSFNWSFNLQTSLSYLRSWVCSQHGGKELMQQYRIEYNAPTGKDCKPCTDPLKFTPQLRAATIWR